ncbi:glycoside hydrolase domain-containing protein [Micromonospora sp. NPDC126480]|uniref:glycoside hydrolase domain-containing protein n=1 Tax=Micromonospora sp. NPDC126480 TaxID=3155312 RepID=UPI003328D3D1
MIFRTSGCRSRRLATGLTAALATALIGTTALTAPPTTGAASDFRPVAAVTGPQPGTFTGYAFDTCTAPSSAQMQAWLQSPYRAVGVYIGGVNRACGQPNLTREWVAAQLAAGWRIIPLYVGLQAPCAPNFSRRIDPSLAEAQGRAEADDAATQARNLGLARDSVLIVDIEAYPTPDPVCTDAVNRYVSAWSARVHDNGFLSGYYSSLSSGVADQVAAYPRVDHVRPDYLDFAKWDGVATVDDPAIPAGYWAPKRRMKQYRGDHDETWGGVTINIDSNYVDFATLPTTSTGDFTGNGWSDLLYVDGLTGQLRVRAGNGTSLNVPVSLSGGWKGMDAVVRPGNFDRAGGEDVIAREAATGNLWLYPGTGSGGLASRIRIGTGWTGLREITPIGDHNRDGYPDLLAVSSAGALYLYPGRGTAFGSRIVLAASGWGAMDELTGGPDLDGDGQVDLIARKKSTGELYRYPVSTAGKLGSPVRVGSGFAGKRDLVRVGDFDRDGRADLMALDARTGTLDRYSWSGSGWSAPVRVGNRWTTVQRPLL